MSSTGGLAALLPKNSSSSKLAFIVSSQVVVMVHLEVPEKYSPISYYFVPPAPRVNEPHPVVPERWRRASRDGSSRPEGYPPR
jgi:hypothetical protein